MKIALVCVLLVSCAAYQAHANRLFPGLPGISDLTDGIKRVIGNFDNRMDKLLSGLKDITRNLNEVRDCFMDQIGDDNSTSVNIFNSTLNFREVVEKYFKAFPNKTVDSERIRNLLDSTKDIITRCLDPERRNQNDTAVYGYTELSDQSPEEIQQLLGLELPNELDRAKRQLSSRDSRCQASARSAPSSFDWRDKNAVTSVKNQGQCGSCWSFAALGALESALVINERAPLSVDLSEQQLVNCAKSGGRGCQGGNSIMAFDYIQKNGVTEERNDPYRAKEGTCSRQSAAYSISDFCVRSKYRYTYSMTPEKLSDDDIAAALHANGPLYIAIDANPLTYRNYRAGTIASFSSCTDRINHAVLLVGYDQNSWIIKNSWGTRWGDKGFFRLARGRNMCGVNTEIAWPVL